MSYILWKRGIPSEKGKKYKKGKKIGKTEGAFFSSWPACSYLLRRRRRTLGGEKIAAANRGKKKKKEKKKEFRHILLKALPEGRELYGKNLQGG